MDSSKNVNVYIIDIEANKLVKENLLDNDYEIKEEDRDSLYSGSLPASLDLLKLGDISTKAFYFINKRKRTQFFKDKLLNKPNKCILYTDAIINISFNKAFRRKHDESQVDSNEQKNLKTNEDTDNLSSRELREKLYKEGVDLIIGGKLIKYVKYKRSSSKAREGSHLFIKEELMNKMSDRRKFGINYKDDDKDVPLAALKTYESLTSSGIEKIIEIKPSQILLINDYKAKTFINASVTKVEDGTISVENHDNYEIENDIWDGQSLADPSLFEGEIGEQKGMMLLRNSYFKSCAFNTNIQKWFDDFYGDDKPEFILDKFGREIKLSDVKLITTPNSLKFLKFAGDGIKQEQKFYEKWLKEISEEFGVVKSENSSPYEEFQQLTYQIINSLPLTKDKIGIITEHSENIYFYEGLLKHDLIHIDKMRNDVEYFKSHINIKDPLPSDALLLKLLEVNEDMWNTKMLKEYVADKVEKYQNKLRNGKIKVKGDYAVLFGNPLEMLQYATFDNTKSDSKFDKIVRKPLVKGQIYCSKYDNGTKLAGFRNPHITMGNVLVAENTYREEFDVYFNLTDNIVISNAYDSDVMERLQGQDYDSDEILLSNDIGIVRAAEACINDKFRVPLNGIKGENKKREYDVSEEVEIDHRIAKNIIGEIVNLSQILNSYYWDYNNDNIDGRYDDKLAEIYSKISMLSSLSQIEIDRSKKDYTISIYKFLKELRCYAFEDEILSKRSKTRIRKPKTSKDNKGEQFKGMKKDTDEAFYRNKYKTREEVKEAIAKLTCEKDVLHNSGEEIEMSNKRIQEIDDELEDIDKYCSYDELDTSKNVTNGISKPESLIRPYFFKYCAERIRIKKEKYKKCERKYYDKYDYVYFNTPMDYLQKLIKTIPHKDSTITYDISEIIPKPNFEIAPKEQLDCILEHCEIAHKAILRQQHIQKKTGEKRHQQIREAYDKAEQKIGTLKTNENTIRVVIYRTFSEVEVVSPKKGSEYYVTTKGKICKYLKKEYRRIRRMLVSILYKACKDEFMKVIEMSKENV